MPNEQVSNGPGTLYPAGRFGNIGGLDGYLVVCPDYRSILEKIEALILVYALAEIT